MPSVLGKNVFFRKAGEWGFFYTSDKLLSINKY